MAIAELSTQRATKAIDAVDSTTLAFPGNVTAGNLLLVMGTAQGAADTSPWTVTDTIGTVYTKLLTSNSVNNVRSCIAYGLAPSSGANTVTVDPTGATLSISFSIDEFSGVKGLDVDGSFSTGTSTAPADSITTGVTNALIIGVMNYNTGNTTINPPSGWTQIGEAESDSGGIPHNAAFLIATTATSYTATWAIGTSQAWEAMTASFQPKLTAGLLSLIGIGT